MNDANGDGFSRRVHERKVVEALRRAPTDAMGQPELIRETGLARGTVVNIVERLKEKNLVDTDMESKSGPEGGRPAKVVRLRPDAGYALGVQFGHRHVRVSAGNLRGYQVFFREKPVGSTNEAEIDVGADAQASLELAVDLVEAAISQNEDEGRGLEKLLALAVGWPAPVQDWRTGDVVIDDSMRPWLGIRRPADKLKEMLAFDVDIDFWTENDANLAAIMEMEHGLGRDHRDFIYVHWSSGIGGALVSSGSPQLGGARLAGELGHIPLSDEAPAPKPCRRCGSDHCLEILAGGTAIVRNVTGGVNASLRNVISMAQGTDSQAKKARQELERAARLVGKALGPVITFNNPTAIILGGQFGRDAEGMANAGGRRSQENPYDLVEGAFRSSLQEHTSPRALNAVLEINSSRWRYGAVQGAVAFATRKALDKYVNDRAGASAGRQGQQRVV
jgi:predicted NBD/HSP70 family sugar kinase